VWRHIEDDPMVIHPVGTKRFGNIGIVHDENEAFGIGRDVLYFERGIDVFPFAGINGGDYFAFLKSRTL